MSDELIKLPARKGGVPAELRKLAGQMQEEGWESGTTGGFPVLSIKSKVWHVRRGAEEELVTRPGEDDEPASTVEVVVLKANVGVAKTYYKKTYEEGDKEQPDCYSKDGIAPAADARDRQAKKCATCPHNQWGSRITEGGAKAKKCSDNKRLAVAPVGQLNDPMLLRVPPTSLKSWDNYTRSLQKRGLTPTMVITKVGFDHSVAHQLLTFKAVNYVPEEHFDVLGEVLADPMLDMIVDSGSEHGADAIPVADVTDEDVEDEEDEAPAPPPKKKAPAKRKAKPKPEPEPEPDEDEDDEDDEEEDDTDLDDLDLDDLDFGDDD